MIYISLSVLIATPTLIELITNLMENITFYLIYLVAYIIPLPLFETHVFVHIFVRAFFSF